MYLVNLTYFKSTGQYYAAGNYQSEKSSLQDIWDEVRSMSKHPGLSGRWNEGPISVEVPEHPHAHPRLIVP